MDAYDNEAGAKGTMSDPKDVKNIESQERTKIDNEKKSKNKTTISYFNEENKFSVFKYLTEKEIDSIIMSGNLRRTSHLKRKCRRCSFRGYCHLNITGCRAIQKNCFSCDKLGHFPQSQNCKATRNEKYKRKVASKCHEPKLSFTKLERNGEESFKSCFTAGAQINPNLLELIQHRIKFIENRNEEITSPL